MRSPNGAMITYSIRHVKWITTKSHPPMDGLGRAAVVLGRASFLARSISRLQQVRPIGIRYNGEERPGTTDWDFKFQRYDRESQASGTGPHGNDRLGTLNPKITTRAVGGVWASDRSASRQTARAAE